MSAARLEQVLGWGQGSGLDRIAAADCGPISGVGAGLGVAGFRRAIRDVLVPDQFGELAGLTVGSQPR